MLYLERRFLARSPLFQRLPYRRPYALSRFDERAPGGRTVRHPRTVARARVPLAHESEVRSNLYEERPSDETSPLRHASRRPPNGNPEEGLKRLLANDTLIVTRQIEMLNIFIGFEQANRYAITNEDGDPLGYIAEEPRGFFSVFARQLFRTHRPFRALVMDRDGSPILWLKRPFAWINSRMFIQRLKDFHEYTEDGEPVPDTFAEVQQRWHLWRRRYDLFLREDQSHIVSKLSELQLEPGSDSFTQFARIDGGFLAWHFRLFDGLGEEIASVNRAFRGFGREIFTDTGQYYIRFTPSPPDLQDPSSHALVVPRNLTLEERALVLALSVNVDFDYFSRHSEAGHGGMFWWGGGFGDE